MLETSNGGLAQMVERALSMREAVGSIPTSSKIKKKKGEEDEPTRTVAILPCTKSRKNAAGKIDWPPANFYYYCTVP